MPVEYMQHIDHSIQDGVFHINYKQENVCWLGVGVEPRPDNRLGSETSYKFSEGLIEREDTFYPTGTVAVQEIQLEIAVFSDNPTQKGHQVTFGSGHIIEVEAYNFTSCDIENVENDRNYHTPVGAPLWRISWRFSLSAHVAEPFSV